MPALPAFAGVDSGFEALLREHSGGYLSQAHTEICWSMGVAPQDNQNKITTCRAAPPNEKCNIAFVSGAEETIIKIFVPAA